ncbi:LysM peptidoglycan-binding domain-containing protein, partial [Rhodobaculum claviforme]
MNAAPRPTPLSRLCRAGMLTSALALLAGCAEQGFDWDLRPPATGSTADAARQVAGTRPAPDARGVISYPTYQVALAQRDETVADVARRLGLDGAELARRNAVSPDTRLREGEVLTLPARLPDAPGARDVGAIATTALDRVDSGPLREAPAQTRSADEPLQHRVERGETAFTIARLYNVTPRALADWNGLGADMAVREGQTLMIPVARAEPTPQRTAAA